MLHHRCSTGFLIRLYMIFKSKTKSKVLRSDLAWNRTRVKNLLNAFSSHKRIRNPVKLDWRNLEIKPELFAKHFQSFEFISSICRTNNNLKKEKETKNLQQFQKNSRIFFLRLIRNLMSLSYVKLTRIC